MTRGCARDEMIAIPFGDTRLPFGLGIFEDHRKSVSGAGYFA